MKKIQKNPKLETINSYLEFLSHGNAQELGREALNRYFDGR